MGLSLFATVPGGMESLLAGELRGLGAGDVRQLPAGVSFAGSLETAYRVCLWSRLAGRVLLTLASGPANDADTLYAIVQRVAWDDQLDADGTLAVDFSGRSETIRDTRFGAVRVKDAIVDQFRARHHGRRPSVDTRAPDVRVNAHLARGRVNLSLDLSGDSLHRRGYRTDKVQVEAPLKENLAAAVLLFATWPKEAAAGGSFLDPLCGSGTLPIEAAWIAADVAPGLLRADRGGGFGFTRWMGHDEALWAGLLAEARERREAGLGRLRAAPAGPLVRGSDHDARAVHVAQTCVEHAGLSGTVAIDRVDLVDVRPPAARGLVAANAPFGERLGDRVDAEALCRLLGERLRAAFAGWRAAVLVGDRRQAAAIGLRPVRDTLLRNGPLDCTLAYYEVGESTGPRSARAAVRSSAARARAAAITASPADAATAGGAPPPGAGETAPRLAERGGEQLANRLRKNLRLTGRAMRRQGVTCYRLYDADLPEYNVAVDVYEHRLHVQEYAPPPEIDPLRAAAHLAEAIDVIAEVLQVERLDIVVKQRRRQRGAAQYERRPTDGALLRVTEDGLSYLVDLDTYLDTGLFLDQRETRRLIRRLAGGRRFLNLFAYTSTATVCAIAGGARATTSVDLSATYLEWSRRNLAQNGVTDVALELAARGGVRAHDSVAPRGAPAHRLIQADCLTWIAQAEGQYDLILLDPPSFSNSKRMGRTTFDVQRDHPDLLRMTARRLLAPRGILLFACNRRGFKLDPAALPALAIKDMSRATLAPDFVRRANAHHVWQIEAR